MPLSAPILGQVSSLSRTFMRQGSVFVLNDDRPYTVAARVGRAKNISINFESISSEADSQGRMNTMGYNVTASFTMMQASAEDLEVAFALAAPTDAEDGANGFNLFFSDEQIAPAQVVTAANGPTPITGGILLVGAIVQVGPELNFSGEESGIPCTITGRVPAARARTFATERVLTLAL